MTKFFFSFLYLIFIFGLGIILTLWAYDGDVKCLVAECRKIIP